MALFPEHRWSPWRFERTPKLWWNKLYLDFRAKSEKAIVWVGLYLLEIAQAHGINSWRDWTCLSSNQLGPTVSTNLRKLGGFYKTLEAVSHHFTSSEQSFEAILTPSELKHFKALFQPTTGTLADLLLSSKQLVSEQSLMTTVGDLLPKERCEINQTD